jgi:hypothetical protein
MTLEVLASGAVGFLGAYVLARMVRHWDEQRAERKERLAKIQAARIPLEVIEKEVIGERISFYFARESEPTITSGIREAVFGLRDEALMRDFIESVVALRRLAWESPSDEIRAACLPHVQGLLKRLRELEAEVPRAGASRWWMRL